MAKISDFAKVLSERYGISAEEAADFVDAMFDVVCDELDAADKSVKIKGLGTFKVTTVGARASVDVNTGERIMLEGRNKISFSPEVGLRDRVNRPFVQFETVVLNDGVDFSEIDREYEETLKACDETVNDVASVADTEKSTTADNDVVEKKNEESTAEQKVAEEDNVDVEIPAIEEDSKHDEPTSDELISDEPTSDEPTSDEPTSDEPTSDELTSDELTSDEPISDEPNACGVESENRIHVEHKGSEEKEDDACTEETVVDQPRYGNDASVDVASLDGPAVESGHIVCKQRNPRLMYWFTAASFVLIVFIGIGMYFLYQKIEAKNNAIEQLKDRLAVATVKAKHVRPKNNAVSSKPVPQSADTSANSKKSATARENETPKENTVANSNKMPVNDNAVVTSSADYNYDARVRTGAYIIVGTDKVVTVKAGQTLSSISKANLGAGMECYVEVFNGKTSVKAGDKLKIPKLKLKPRK